jgi:hypothetical protein
MRPVISEELSPSEVDRRIRTLNEDIARDVKEENAIQERIREKIIIVRRLETQRKVNGTVTA